jgi:hypothetical protein
MTVALCSSGGGKLSVAGFQVLGHFLLEDFLKDCLHALADPSLHVPLDVLLELVCWGQVCSLTQLMAANVEVVKGLIQELTDKSVSGSGCRCPQRIAPVMT